MVLYNSLTRTIAIDFRDYSDDINGIGIRSFIHEYGHFLDYSVGKGLLSMQENFRPFVARYRKKIESLPEKSYVRLKSHYYGAPTEVFARSFEMYAAECGLKSNLLQSKEAYRVLEEYSIMDDSMRMEIFEYFDQTFPEFKSKIREFNGLPALEEQLADVVEETAPYYTKRYHSRKKLV
ncbi:LPD1 domain-containing protein [uncultured Enterococcus sp.]|uniref:LPD1 domain-containing protein n=1 Tax=uncultured Enterococcus sp. TaxID=167972 RepID=UPI002AA933B4|nr:LPD1 domain-containing protein [uncultured Enterococcus sp.]